MLGNLGIQSSSQPLLNGLIGWWRFNGNANDSSKTGYNGSIVGATLTADRFGTANKAYSFSGAPQYISRTAATALNLTDNFTLSAWIYPTGYHTTGYFGLKNCFIAKGPATTYNYVMQINDANTIAFCKRTGSESLQFKTFTGLPDMTNVWTLVTMVITGNFVNLYLNGVYQNQLSVFSIGPGASDTFFMGAGSSNSETGFIGSLDDIRIYNRVLTAGEIATMYNATSDI